MENNSLLNISQLSDELKTGEALIRFIVKRFEKWIPGVDQEGERYYQSQNIITIITLLEKIKNGILPSEIEKEFYAGKIQTIPHVQTNITNRGAEMQERYVKALEDRNEIETLKIQALNKIADRLENLSFDPIRKPDTEPLVKTEQPPSDNQVLIDDLSQLIDSGKNNDIEIDDLSSLLEKEKDNVNQIDDLSKLIEDNTAPVEIDDLSLLIDTEKSEINHEIDDLSLLIDDKNHTGKIDDLSLLTNDLEFKNTTIDDLSVLIDEEPEQSVSFAQPKSSPKDDFENYKEEIINIIIDLKNQGLSEDETCEQFNKKGILTFSGKKSWSVKTITQVYQLINNAA